MSGEVRAILASADSVSTDIKAIVGNVRAGRGTVGKLLNDDALYASVKSMAADAEKAMATVRQASEEARAAIADFRGDKGPVKGLTGDVQQTLQSARDAMADLAETTEALKRNFFFRGFFNRRGYFDLDDVSVAQYRQGALESKDRRVLRIWLDADVLFEQDANGVERLSRRREDPARLGDVAVPAISTEEPVRRGRIRTGRDGRRSLSQQPQRARSWSATTSSAKFKLDPNYVAIMPMGAEAPGSPTGREWNGVALALFVRPRRPVAGTCLVEGATVQSGPRARLHGTCTNLAWHAL